MELILQLLAFAVLSHCEQWYSTCVRRKYLLMHLSITNSVYVKYTEEIYFVILMKHLLVLLS